MDRTWVLLMLHSGLRTGEIRHLRLDDLDLDKRQVRIEQGKGLQDRVVFLSREGVEALQAYLAVRGPAATDHVFIYRHRPLSQGYCNQRLRAYGRGCGLHITAHQLRYSCATLQYRIDSGGWITATQSQATSFDWQIEVDTKALSDGGPHSFQARGLDLAGYVETERSRSFRVDNQLPAATISATTFYTLT